MKKFLYVLSFLFISGCFSTPNSNFYMLQSLSQKTVSDKKLQLQIYDISIPEYIDKPQIVLQEADSPELEISEFNRWGSNLSSMIKNTLINDLSVNLPNAKILPLAYGINTQYVVKIQIEKLSGWLKDKAILKANWQILNAKGKVLAFQTFTFEEQAGKTYASYVKAQSKLLADLSFVIADKLKNM
ncbi:MAG: membrane integrity-associated transporter subunit PqiC [Alphaproteobacteria bacterium]|nr:membrane integrity-associated transporter subunit PqiC [Alphaproteobacteria bacterium]